MKKQETADSTIPEVQQKKPNWLLSFTGLIPVVLAIPILVLHLWTVSIIVTLASALIVISYHLSRKQGITSLDSFSLLFGCLNAILYFGFHSTIVLQHLDTTIYTILFVQVVYSLIVNKPWTEQYARRTTSAELWETKPFHDTNRFLTILWGVVFLACDLISLLVSLSLLRLLLPVLLLVLLAVLARWHAGLLHDTCYLPLLHKGKHFTPLGVLLAFLWPENALLQRDRYRCRTRVYFQFQIKVS